MTPFFASLAMGGGGGSVLLSTELPIQNSIQVGDMVSNNVLISSEAISSLKAVSANSSIELNFGNFSKIVRAIEFSQGGAISIKTTDGSQFQVVEK
jgi:hypothetical protein